MLKKFWSLVWNKRLYEWTPYGSTRKKGKPKTRWREEICNKLGVLWTRSTENQTNITLPHTIYSSLKLNSHCLSLKILKTLLPAQITSILQCSKTYTPTLCPISFLYLTQSSFTLPTHPHGNKPTSLQTKQNFNINLLLSSNITYLSPW